MHTKEIVLYAGCDKGQPLGGSVSVSSLGFGSVVYLSAIQFCQVSVKL